MRTDSAAFAPAPVYLMFFKFSFWHSNNIFSALLGSAQVVRFTVPGSQLVVLSLL